MNSTQKRDFIHAYLAWSDKASDWYATEHNVTADDFTCRSVCTYGVGCDALGELADLIISDAEIDGFTVDAAPDSVSRLLDRIRPTTLRAVADRIPASVLGSFGIDDAEHDDLLDEDGLVAELDGEIIVHQYTSSYGLGWYRVGDHATARPIISDL